MIRQLLPAAMCALLLSACVTVPQGPSVMALPGAGKNWNQFQADDAYCRQFASGQTGNVSQNAVNSGVESAAVGTVVGAAAGALLGGHQGAAVGAGSGLLLGSAVGAGAAQDSGRITQRSYDNAYIQCMYAHGEKVPMSAPAHRVTHYAPPPASYAPPPDGIGYPPPPY
ncbi:glycine zipper family protein [Paludibacterium yongneupense]|uniref:glycine zipper family protein n=1 Tax=Paludibacterium yongneupense TaxID=400061 RepID=UPI0003F990C4|nr:glycine zipper family protein [Paludibacterium yongneupense]